MINQIIDSHTKSPTCIILLNTYINTCISVCAVPVRMGNGNVPQTYAMEPAQFMETAITLHLMGKDTLLTETANTH